ncbi:MAG: hypothetical protein QXZ31_05640 [Thermofilaceae archaeon]
MIHILVKRGSIEVYAQSEEDVEPLIRKLGELGLEVNPTMKAPCG